MIRLGSFLASVAPLHAVFPGSIRGAWHGRIVTVSNLTFPALSATILLLGAVFIDGMVRPRPVRMLRSATGLWLQACMMTALAGLFLALCGNVMVSVGLALAVLALLALVSNAKHAMLGEPLLFSDLALIGAIFRHPQFYLSAVSIPQRLAVGVAIGVLLATLAWLFVPDLEAHLLGVGLCGAGLAALVASLQLPRFRKLGNRPDAYADSGRFGLLPTLLLYWLRWRTSLDPPYCADVDRLPASYCSELIVVIQCESFADPVELFGDPDLALPGLSFARQAACQWGNLEVSGFGAYTMRTEYGVLFGREEDALGFRRYDPFLTALGEGSYALPARLKDWRSFFLHPHDMRFYGRDRIMPAAGFTQLVGEERFMAPGPEEGRYVTDAAMADTILELARSVGEPSLIYAVTIENHGPWAPQGAPGNDDLVQSYLRLARNSDAMLTNLLEGLREIGRPATLVFFGDHRPSIPGATVPGGDRHTPYVMVRMDAEGAFIKGEGGQADLTPAKLHHVILDAVLGQPIR